MTRALTALTRAAWNVEKRTPPWMCLTGLLKPLPCPFPNFSEHPVQVKSDQDRCDVDDGDYAEVGGFVWVYVLFVIDLQ